MAIAQGAKDVSILAGETDLDIYGKRVGKARKLRVGVQGGDER